MLLLGRIIFLEKCLPDFCNYVYLFLDANLNTFNFMFNDYFNLFGLLIAMLISSPQNFEVFSPLCVKNPKWFILLWIMEGVKKSRKIPSIWCALKFYKKQIPYRRLIHSAFFTPTREKPWNACQLLDFAFLNLRFSTRIFSGVVSFLVVVT